MGRCSAAGGEDSACSKARGLAMLLSYFSTSHVRSSQEVLLEIVEFETFFCVQMQCGC